MRGKPAIFTRFCRRGAAYSDACVIRRIGGLYAGISNYPAAATRQAAEILKRLGTPCLIHQPRFNMFQREPLNEGVFDAAAENGMGIITYSPLAQGVLTNRYLSGIPKDSRATHGKWFDQSQIDAEHIERLKKLNDIAKARGQSLAQMAIAWVLHDSRITSALIGASKVEQVIDCANSVAAQPFECAQLSAISKLI